MCCDFAVFNYSLPGGFPLGFPGGSDRKASACNEGDLGLIPGLGRSPGEGEDYPLQYSGLENSMDYSMGSQRVEHNGATFTFTLAVECFIIPVKI